MSDSLGRVLDSMETVRTESGPNRRTNTVPQRRISSKPRREKKEQKGEKKEKKHINERIYQAFQGFSYPRRGEILQLFVR